MPTRRAIRCPDLIRPLLAAAALTLAAAAPANQQDLPVAPPEMKGQPMAFIGLGALTNCAGFLRAADAERQQRPPGAENPEAVRTPLYGALMAWADGYLTAKNEDDVLHRLAGNSTTITQRGRWLELFCQANPDARFFDAVYKLRDHLVAEGE
jgi:hypothetical protein